MSDNIKVVVKVRPLIPREIEEKLFHQWRVKDNTIYQIDQAGKDCGNLYTFDKVYDENTNTSDVYKDIAKPIVEAATAGFNGTIFAYGQTCSGKTFTMTGTETSPGLIHLSVINLFDIIKNITDRHFLIRVSYVEIYNETIIDLLNTEKKNIKIQDTFQGVKVDATVRVTTTPEEVFQSMKEGQANRQTGATNMNEESSRSHSIFQITIESREHTEGEELGEKVGVLNVSELNLVDLAGSERSGQTGAIGIRFKEGTHINKSLSSLALVIKQLSEGLSKHVNYRDSKLTRILQNSLGGNAKTSIICAVTPAAVEETISTLQFAYRAKAIKNNPVANVVATDPKLIDNLTRQLSSLKTQLESKKNLEEDNQKLQKHIAVLQRFLSGFVQRGADKSRLGQPLRRATISAPPTQDDHAFRPPSIPEFCTPTLKYNPMALGRSMETLSKQSTGGLASVPEEPAGNTTPSPNNKITSSDEIIEIDSDDNDAPSDVQTCSPYHKCYKSTKTPPCVLRKNAEEAERNLKDIVELTERERIFKHDVVDLLEKLENSTTVITKLEEEIEMLNNINKENESKMEILNNKIMKNEAEVRSLTTDKLHLEERCKEFVTKLTDWEVTYETLKKKSKTREDELLLRLEEYSKITKPLNTCISPEIAAIKDMKRGLSIVDSDNSISNENIEQLITDLKEQIAVRDKNISELEANLFTQNQRVTFLENKTEELEKLLDSSNQKLINFENETSLHKTTIETLNSIIENQKCNLETATNDLRSYNDTIQELRNQISEKENLQDTLDHTQIRDLIAIEENSIANNENIANIIKSLQAAIDTKNSEVELLKSTIQINEKNDDNTAFSKKLEPEAQKMRELQEKVTVLTQQLQDIQTEKEEKLLEKTSLLRSLEDLNNELAISAKSKIELDNKIKNYETEIKNINESNQDLLKRLNEKTSVVTQLTAMNTELTNELKANNVKIDHLQNNLQLKDTEISSMLKSSNDQVNKFQTLILELHDILSIMKGKNVECSKIDSCSSDIFETLSGKLTDLRNNISTLVSERDKIKMQYTSLSTSILKTGKEVFAAIKSAVDDINVIHNTLRRSIEQKSVSESKTSDNEISQEYCFDNGSNETEEDGKEQDISCPQLMVLLEKIPGLILNVKQKIGIIKLESNSGINRLTHLLEARDLKIAQLDQKINEINEELDQKSRQLISAVEEYNAAKKESYETFNDIVGTIINMSQKLNIEYYVPCQDKIGDERTYFNNHIVPLLDRAVVLFLSSQSESCKKIKKEENIIQTNEEIGCLTEQNTQLNENMLQIERSSNETSRDLQEERESLIQSLKTSSNLLNELKEELKMKVEEIDSMKNKIFEWKDKINKLELMKKQQNEVYEENIRLKEKCREYESIQKEFERHSNSLITEVKEKCAKESLQVNNESDSKFPLSLSTLCFNRIIHTIQDDASQTVTSVSSKSNLVEKSSESSLTCYQCNKLKTELEYAQNKNDVLINLMEESKLVNENLMKEIKDASVEIKSLIDYTNDLQKRILSHKTNLSTLTATTYAENKSLSSQVKFLQHHHTRFHTVCQRDLPELKEQLHELRKLLKEENLEGKSNTSFKRLSLPSPIENNSIVYSFKNESTLDGDLLMLDTNVTLVNSADNTLTDHDQTCLEIAEACLYNDKASQTSACFLQESHELNVETSQSLNQKLMVENLRKKNVIKVSVETSPIKDFSLQNETESNTCKDCKHHREKCEQLIQEIEENKLQFTYLSGQKDDIEKKYSLEIQSTEALMRKLNNFEKELDNKNRSIEKLSASLKATKDKLDSVQEENENLSTEIIESLSAVDNLKMELDSIQKNYSNKELKLDAKRLDKECPECLNKQEIIKILQSKNSNTHNRLNRSYSDSDSSSRYNKICTLQNELDAGREDCNELKEEVTTIKNHLEGSNLSMGEAMDLDESISEVNVVDVNKSCMPEISEEHAADIYSLDKTDCYNYYVELVGDDKTNLNRDLKIIDIMKMLHSKLMIKHENRIDNLVNKLRDYEDLKQELQQKIINLRNNIINLSNVIENNKDSETNEIELFKTKILMVLDSEFSMNSLTLFECIYHKKLSNLNAAMEECARLQEYSQKLDIEHKIAKNDLIQIKDQQTAKENECNLLLAQKEDFLKQGQDFLAAFSEGYQKLVEENILEANDIDTSLPPMKNINILFIKLASQNKAKIENHKQEIRNYKRTIEQKDRDLQVQTEQFEIIKKLNEKIQKKLKENEDQIQIQKSLLDDLNVIYNKKIEEYNVQVTLVQSLTEEVVVLKEFVSSKETIIQNLQKKMDNMESEYDNLKRINQLLDNEKESMAAKLKKAEVEIEKHKIDHAKMEFDIRSLKESLKQNVSDVDSRKNEAESLLEQKLQLKQELDQKCKDYARLEFNIKTHETTAMIQANMISRLQKQKEEDMNIIAEKEKQLRELNQKFSMIQKETAETRDCIEVLRREKDALIHLTQTLEDKISQLKELEGGHKPRLSIETAVETARRRRQSMQDSNRTFGGKPRDQIKPESSCDERSKPDDMYMDVDESSSNRSTPMRRHSKGRDSQQREESEEEGRLSRCSGARASRQRRQSSHDLHRMALHPTPDGHESSRNISKNESKHDLSNESNTNRVKELQECLSSCQHELEELKERYRELDEECETCAEYLQERDEQCRKLKKEKASLENIIKELNEQLQRGHHTSRGNANVNYAHAAVNTDEDWANLHSVVVDRMSFDAEVEKNKRLTKLIEELRMNKQELKTVVAKMQRALEEKTTKDGRELERTRLELRSCKEELEELRRRNVELDEECETCAQYLKEKEEQCRSLKESVAALEAKLEDQQASARSAALSARKRRQSQHDHNREPPPSLSPPQPPPPCSDAATQITEDFLSYQVERDRVQPVPDDIHTKQIKRLKVSIEKLSREKAALEQQLATAATAPVYVATGSAIVQGQQLSDIMKENQKLKNMNANLISLCKKRKPKAIVKSNRENQEPMGEI